MFAKGLKKVVSLAMATMITGAVLVSCGGASPSSVVEDYFKEVAKGSEGEKSKEIVGKIKEEAQGVDQETVDKISKAIEGSLNTQMKKLKCTVDSEDIKDSKATVKVTIEGANLADSMVRYMKNSIGKIMEAAFSGKELSEAETTELVEKTMKEELDASKVDKRKGEVELKKGENGWEIVETPDLFTLVFGEVTEKLE